jgi:hypothetical protein
LHPTSGFDRQWHLGSIDVVAEKDGFNITAAHDNWLYAGADPVLIYRSTDNIDYLVSEPVRDRRGVTHTCHFHVEAMPSVMCATPVINSLSPLSGARCGSSYIPCLLGPVITNHQQHMLEKLPFKR